MELTEEAAPPRGTAGLRLATGILAMLAISAALAGALVIVGDVLGRALFSTSVFALNEITSMVFAVAVAFTLPAGAALRVNLKIDLLAHLTGPRLTAWLRLAGSLILLVFFALLAWRLCGLSLRYWESGRATPLLQVSVAPTYLAIGLALGAAALVQVAMTAEDWAALRAERRTGRSHPVVLALAAAMILSVLGIGLWILLDFDGFAAFSAMRPGLAAAIAVAIMWGAVLLQIPLAAATALVAVVGAMGMLGPMAALNTFASDTGDFLRNDQVATLPMFLIMGAFAVAAGVSDDLFRLGNALLGRFRGGLAYATVLGCACFGAVSGNSIATSATFGRMALPAMARAGYAPGLATGSVAAGGTLGALVPPSGVLVLFALLTESSIGALFVAAMVPAALAVVLYFAAIFVTVRLNPAAAPASPAGVRGGAGAAVLGSLPVIAMFGLVIGGLYAGLFTATESAAVGAVSAFLLAVLRGRLNRRTMLAVFSETTATTAMIYALIFGGLMFAFFINLGGMPDMMSAWVAAIDARPVVVLIVLIVIYLILGSVMDSFAVMIITVPVITPIVLAMGYDILFWGVLMLVVVEIGMISPPFGMNLFILKSIDRDVRLGTVMRGVLPFVAVDLVKIALLVAIPALSLWLPSTM